jgi:hypothetical protein
MENRSRISGKSRYASNAALYQPDQGQLKRTLSLVSLLFIVVLIGLATRTYADGSFGLSGALIEQSAVSGLHGR